MANFWIQALKEWNTGKKEMYCIPKKGSNAYNEVRAIMNKMNADTTPKKAPVKKVVKKEAPKKEAPVKKAPVKKAINKESKKDFDKISGELQRLILLTNFNKIKKVLASNGYKGKLETNKILLTQQLLQNFNTIDMMEDLIKKLSEEEKLTKTAIDF